MQSHVRCSHENDYLVYIETYVVTHGCRVTGSSRQRCWEKTCRDLSLSQIAAQSTRSLLRPRWVRSSPQAGLVIGTRSSALRWKKPVRRFVPFLLWLKLETIAAWWLEPLSPYHCRQWWMRQAATTPPPSPSLRSHLAAVHDRPMAWLRRDTDHLPPVTERFCSIDFAVEVTCYKCKKLQFIHNVNGDGSKTSKIIQRQC